MFICIYRFLPTARPENASEFMSRIIDRLTADWSQVQMLFQVPLNAIKNH
jgi:hypothetical protein